MKEICHKVKRCKFVVLNVETECKKSDKEVYYYFLNTCISIKNSQ